MISSRTGSCYQARVRGLALIVVLGLCVSCGASTHTPAPCMSDRECEGSRVCHQGTCMFEQEARLALARQLEDPPSDASVGEVSSGGEVPDGPPLDAEPFAELPMFMGGPQRSGRSHHTGPLGEFSQLRLHHPLMGKRA